MSNGQSLFDLILSRMKNNKPIVRIVTYFETSGDWFYKQWVSKEESHISEKIWESKPKGE